MSFSLLFYQGLYALAKVHYEFVLILGFNLQSGGPSWEVQTGRRDSLSASKEAANNNVPGPNSTVATLVAKFENVGLSLNDMVALSGNNILFLLIICSKLYHSL